MGVELWFINQSLTSPTQQTITSDSNIKSIDNQEIIISDSYIIEEGSRTITSDSKIISNQEQKTIISDSHIKSVNNQESILSDAIICTEVLYNISQKINFTKSILSDINNKFNCVIRVFSNINNFINTCCGIIVNVNNDFRTKKLMLNNINNDIRFLYSWQKAVGGGLLSLGKEYIKVYIGGVEQTDVDVDSISISKDLDNSHNASFDLGRAYDSTKPTMESVVLIKYNNWTLFSGYITQISPTEGPEKMRINCQDEYWKQNKVNVYYNIGHKPTDNQELYYETLMSALTTQHSWTPGVGNFTPQTINNFSIGKSDAITNIIKECGNYSWFYDVDGTKKLWSAGLGTVININRQVLGTNIGLYDLINHSFSEDSENLVNKLRVQMGNKVIQKNNNSRTYTGYNYSSYHQFVTPAWDRTLEYMCWQTASGHGFDHRDNTDWKNVFTKYTMPYLNPKLSSWSDAHPPYVEIYNIGNAFGFVGPLNLQLEKTLKEGFTIDYENKTITFNEPWFLYQTNANGECTSVRAPIIKVFLWKKNYYTYTSNPTDNPETDVTNPLMFFTSKMGTYTDTIIKDLNLSNLSIQEGLITHDDSTGEDTIIPSWDDTDFAKEQADWQLSKTCDVKINGTIELTLDAVCFYGIDLTKRIFINGITDAAMNIVSMSYNIQNFTVTLTLENSRYYNRTCSIPSHGE